MSSSSTSKNCIICAKNLSRGYQNESLDDQLAVIFFLRKFLKYPLIPSEEYLYTLLIKDGDPTNWISFCLPCSLWVQEARKLYRNVSELQAKLNILRDTVESKVIDTYQRHDHSTKEVSSRTGGGHSIFHTVRGLIFQEKTPNKQRGQRQQQELKEFEEQDGNQYQEFFAQDSLLFETPESSSLVEVKMEHDFEDEAEEEGLHFEIDPSSDVDEFEEMDLNCKVNFEEDPSTAGEEYSEELETRNGKPRGGPKKSKVELRTCPVCNVIFNKPSMMKRHLNSKHLRAEIGQCTGCGKGFYRKDSLVYHMDFNCSKINRNSLQNNGGSEKTPLRISGRQKSDVALRTCTICQRLFDRPSFMKRHMLSVHKENYNNNNSEEQVSNDGLNEQFITPDEFSETRALNAGGRQKSSEASRTCTVCKRLFDKPSLMIRHFKSKHQNKELINSNLSEDATNTDTNMLEPDSSNPLNLREFRPRASDKEMKQETEDEDQWVDDNDDKDYLDTACDSDNNSDAGSNYSDECTTKKIQRTVNKSSKKKFQSRRSQKSSIDSRTCPVCKEVFDRPSKMTVHLNLKHEKKRLFSCDECSKSFMRVDYLRDHQWIHVNAKRMLNAGESAELTHRIKKRFATSRTKATVESRTCPVCKWILATPSKMAIHLNTQHERKLLFECDICNRGFVRRDYLYSHKRTHLGANEKTGTVTEGSVNAEGELDGTQINPKSQKYLNRRTCPVCQKVFNRKFAMEQHLNCVHRKTESCICELCGKVFVWRETLRKHMKSHGPDGTLLPTPRDFKCSFEGCVKTFTSKRYQVDHEKIHSDVKNYLCGECGISFRHRLTLQRHTLSQHQKAEKKHSCNLCGKSFLLKTHLAQHLRSKSHGGVGFSKTSESSRTKNKIKKQLSERSSKINETSSSSENPETEFAHQPSNNIPQHLGNYEHHNLFAYNHPSSSIPLNCMSTVFHPFGQQP